MSKKTFENYKLFFGGIYFSSFIYAIICGCFVLAGLQTVYMLVGFIPFLITVLADRKLSSYYKEMKIWRKKEKERKEKVAKFGNKRRHTSIIWD